MIGGSIGQKHTAVTENKDREKARDVVALLQFHVYNAEQSRDGDLVCALPRVLVVAALELIERYAPGGGR